MFDPSKLIRQNILTLKPYSSARDEFSGSEGIFLDANENPFGSLNRYPDPYQRNLKEKISVLKNIPAENIFLGNGSDEIIDLCFRLFCKPGTDKALTFTPTYGMYSVSAEINDIELISLPLDNNFQVKETDIEKIRSIKNLKLIILCSPNNPTGNLIKRELIERILKSFNGIVLIDEAYNDFSGEDSFNRQLAEFPNLIVMQTFSKAFGMASVRVGMAFAGSETVKWFNKIKPPYNISSVNQKTIMKKLGNKESIDACVSGIIKERSRMMMELKVLECVKHIYPSDANFLLVEVSDPNSIYNYLINKGIIVRNRSSVVPGTLRITIGTRAENNKLLRALKKFMDK